MKIRLSMLLTTGMLMAASMPALAQTEIVCTQIGCVNGLSLSVDTTYRWSPGKYTFTFVMPDQTITCEGALPLKPCGTPSITCDKSGVMISESGCALPSDIHGFSDIQISGAPQSVYVTVTQDDTVIAQQDMTPTYTTSQPNGPQCEPVCHSATQKLMLR